MHAGTNDLAPRLKDRPALDTAVKRPAISQRRLKALGSSGKNLANLHKSYRNLCKLAPATHIFISAILPRPCDGSKPLRAGQPNSFNEQLQHHLTAWSPVNTLVPPRPLNMSFLDHESLFSDPRLFRADLLHLGDRGQVLLRQIFTQALQQQFATVPRVVHSADLLEGVWNQL